MLKGNRLKDAGGVTIDGVALDLSAIQTPVMIVALKDDHVAAWKNTYAGRGLFGGPAGFLPGGSGPHPGLVHPQAPPDGGERVRGGGG